MATPNTFTLDYIHDEKVGVNRSFSITDYDYVVEINCDDIALIGSNIKYIPVGTNIFTLTRSESTQAVNHP